MPKFITVSGLRLRVGSSAYRWYVRNFKKAKPAPKPAPPAPKSARDRIVAAAKWGVAHTAQIHYSEAAIRSQAVTQPFGKLPLTTDCSGFATCCYREAGLPDPNGLGYKELGYTGTLLDHAQKAGKIVATAEALPGDLIVYGPGTGAHVAIVVEAGADPLTVSHGDEAGPEYVRVSQDGRQPQRVCRYL